jgi:hypothetical protein
VTAIRLYQIAAVVFILFAAGHTYGFLRLRAPTPEARAVYDSMNSVRFEMDSRSYSYGDFYRGFGLSATVSMLLSAYLAWYLAGLARTAPASVGMLGWVFCAAQLPGVVLSYLYFGVPPMVFSAAVALLLGAAAWRVGK